MLYASVSHSFTAVVLLPRDSGTPYGANLRAQLYSATEPLFSSSPTEPHFYCHLQSLICTSRLINLVTAHLRYYSALRQSSLKHLRVRWLFKSVLNSLFCSDRPEMNSAILPFRAIKASVED